MRHIDDIIEAVCRLWVDDYPTIDDIEADGKLSEFSRMMREALAEVGDWDFHAELMAHDLLYSDDWPAIERHAQERDDAALGRLLRHHLDHHGHSFTTWYDGERCRYLAEERACAAEREADARADRGDGE